MNKTLVLIRHAHRDTSRRELDNGLDEKGKEQAKAIRRFFELRFQPEDYVGGIWFASSPKLRCQETLLPTAKELGRPVDEHPDLDEQGPRESRGTLEQRVRHFLNEWMESKMDLTIVCSHGDWLPLATTFLLGLPHEFKKGAWLELSRDQGVHELRWYVPNFRPLFK